MNNKSFRITLDERRTSKRTQDPNHRLYLNSIAVGKWTTSSEQLKAAEEEEAKPVPRHGREHHPLCAIHYPRQ